jgi:general secretion pathway protein G
VTRMPQLRFFGRLSTHCLLALRRKRSSEREAGFTLVEMLVVLATIGLIMGLVRPRPTCLFDSKVRTARIQIAALVSALDLYYMDNGSYPSSDLGLLALVQKPAGVSSWNGPYLKSTSVPNDPWGRTYIYTFPGQHGTPYEIISLGSDGQPGGVQSAADIVSWER